MRRISMRVPYDPALDPTTWEGYNPQRWQSKRPQWKQELSVHKMQISAANVKRRTKSVQRKAERAEAERQAEETVRKAVAALEFAMTNLASCPGSAGILNQHQIINGIVFLKTKCGLKFDEATFTKRLKLDDFPRRAGKVDPGS